MELNFKQWLEDCEMPPDDGGLAYKKPEIPNEETSMSKRIKKLFGKEKKDGVAQVGKKR